MCNELSLGSFLLLVSNGGQAVMDDCLGMSAFSCAMHVWHALGHSLRSSTKP